MMDYVLRVGTAVAKDLKAEIPEDMFDENRANICQDCRGLKVTEKTPSRAFKDRDICECQGE